MYKVKICTKLFWGRGGGEAIYYSRIFALRGVSWTLTHEKSEE